jgi:hypothetical protein
MKTKTFTISIILALLMVLPFINGCIKKGEDDPFLSIYTRKARVTGDWTLNKHYSDVKTTEGTSADNQTRTVLQIDGDNWKETFYILGTDSVRETDATILRYDYKFDKNGYYQSVYEYQIVERSYNEDLGMDSTITTVKKLEYFGTWNFLGNIDDYKNKERLALVITEEKYLEVISKYVVSEDDDGAGTSLPTTRIAISKRYANGEMSTIWTLKALKNKEMVIHQNINAFYVETLNGVGTPYTNVGHQEQTLVQGVVEEEE